MGYSLGTAIVEFVNVEDAKKALRDYNGKFYIILEAEIEGKIIKIEFAKESTRKKNLIIRKRRKDSH